MAIKGLIGKEGNTLGTPEQPWEKVYTKPVELTEEHETNLTYHGKPVFEKTVDFSFSNSISTSSPYVYASTSLNIPSTCKIISWTAMVWYANQYVILPFCTSSTNMVWMFIMDVDGVWAFKERHTTKDLNNAPITMKIQYTY